MKTRISVTVSLLIVLAAALAHGQDAPVLARLNIPFSFLVGKTEMPAGKYEFVREANRSILALRNMDNSKATYVHVVERLAAMESSEKHPARVVFDTVGSQMYLSEFWPPSKEDGYLLGVTKGEEKHVVVTQK